MKKSAASRTGKHMSAGRDTCMKRLKELLAAWSSATGIPLDTAAGLPDIRLSGLHTLVLESHRGVRAFAADCVLVETTAGLLSICGSSLLLKNLTGRELRLCGEIRSIALVDRRAS